MIDYNQRRPYLDAEPDGWVEGDRDYLGNNNDLAVRLLDIVDELLEKKTCYSVIENLSTSEIVELSFINYLFDKI